MEKKCPICGKQFSVPYLELWRYKRWYRNGDERYICSWKCLRTFDKQQNAEKEKRKMNYNRRDLSEVLDGMLSGLDAGVDPLKYLHELGYGNASAAYQSVKAYARKNAPEKLAKLPESVHKWREEHARKAKAEEPKEPEEPEDTLADAFAGLSEASDHKPLMYDGYAVRCIEGNFGQFFYDKKHESLDWYSPDGEEVSMSPTAWKKFCTEEIPKVMAILGVKA